MTRPIPVEKQLLAKAALAFGENSATGRHGTRLALLTAVASRLGGHSDGALARLVNCDPGQISKGVTERAEIIRKSILESSVPPALAVSWLAEPSLSFQQRRRDGVFYTDFRLAEYLASLDAPNGRLPLVVDPACGSGALLVATAKRLIESGHSAERVLGECVFGADVSESALQGTLLSLSVLTERLEPVRRLKEHLRRADSLRRPGMWKDVAPRGFDLVVANPPWERLKQSRHEFLADRGVVRHYGQEYDEEGLSGYENAKRSLDRYGKALRQDFGFQGPGELDSSKLFLELALRLVSEDGSIAFVLPASLIRNQGFEDVRKALLARFGAVRVTVFDNKPRFFEIDTRFKFLITHASHSSPNQQRRIELLFATADSAKVIEKTGVTFSHSKLARIRPDFSVPEVRNVAEWKLFEKVATNLPRFGSMEANWLPRFSRELDMTNDRRLFRRSDSKGFLPLVEGRMVHQFKHAAKSYEGGSGRRAVWRPSGNNQTCVFRPQFWINPDDLGGRLDEGLGRARPGFCDITGQTNERTVLAALIPPNVVCGNKVPTIRLANPTSKDTLEPSLLGILNSLVFDWLARRVVTTTLNFFILEGLPIPEAQPESGVFRRLADLTRAASACEHSSQGKVMGDREAEVRVEIEAAVLGMYGLDASDVKTILADFPLVDRSQRPLVGEPESTVTADYVLWKCHQRLGGISESMAATARDRAQEAFRAGARPFSPSGLAIEGTRGEAS